MLLRSMIVPVVFIALFGCAACGSTHASEVTPIGGDGGASQDAAADADAAAAPSTIAACTASFGDPVALASAADGAHVVIEGTATLAPNIVRPQPQGSTCTKGSRAVELITKGDTLSENPVLIANGTTDVFCGCPDSDDPPCAKLAFGPKLRFRGTLSHTSSMGPCNQDPCRRLSLEETCTATP